MTLMTTLIFLLTQKMSVFFKGILFHIEDLGLDHFVLIIVVFFMYILIICPTFKSHISVLELLVLLANLFKFVWLFSVRFVDEPNYLI